MNESNDCDDNLYESIEEEIICSQNESPLINAKTKAKAAGLNAPLPPKQPIQETKLKVDTLTNFRQNSNNEDKVNTNEEAIEEDIHPDTADTDGDLYQIPISGGVPIKLKIDSSIRPFTPPFSQIIKMQRTQLQNSSRKEEFIQATIEEE